MRSLTACLLKNEPATYKQWSGGLVKETHRSRSESESSWSNCHCLWTRTWVISIHGQDEAWVNLSGGPTDVKK